MLEKRCETCRFAEWEYCEGVGPGYPRGFWSICGCKCEEPMEQYNEAWGDTEDCPCWEEAEYDDEY